MRPGRHARPAGAGTGLRQLLVGLVALPLSALPLVGYMNLTPEGRLVRDRAMVALWPPSLPTLTAAQTAAAAAAAPRYDGAVMALAYHGIGSGSDGEGGFVISPGRFAEHLATLKAAGMRTVTAAQVARAFDGGPALPPKAVMISFDDGRSDAMMFADPLLADAEMSATMFVITGAASKPGIYYASWDKLEDYARSGRWDLQAHTAALHREHEAAGGTDLPALTSLMPGESLVDYRARVRADLASASDAVEHHVGRPPVAFAYPFGAYGADRTNHPAIRGILAEEVSRRYSLAFHQDDQEAIPLLTGSDDRLGLRRLEVENWSGGELLERIDRAAQDLDRPEAVAAPGPDAVPVPGATGADDTTPPTTAPTSSTPAAPGTAAPRTPSTTSATTRPGTVSRPPSSTTAPTKPSPTAPPASSTTTSPPTTSPPTTTPTIAPTTTTTTAPPSTTTTTTTTTTVPGGCRSQGQGSVCKPGKGG